MGPDQKKIDALQQKMDALGIRKTDIAEKFIKSSGRGGQKVNKSSSAVYLHHRPTGVSVKVGRHRSQHLNRFIALRSLVEKIEAGMSGTPDREADRMARLKKQKQRRRRRARKKLAGTDPDPFTDRTLPSTDG